MRNQIKKMTFVNGLIPVLNEKVRQLVDCGMHFDEIVSIAEMIQTTSKLSTPQQPAHKEKQFSQWSQGKPMQLQKSDYKLPPIVAATQTKDHHILEPMIQLILVLSQMPRMITTSMGHLVNSRQKEIS